MFDFPLSAVDMTAETNECVQMLNEYAKIMHRYCNNTLEWWNKKLSSNKNWYFDADQALKLGIIDHIIPDQIKGKVRKVKRPKKKHT
jgi:ATP-dependent protease ClpP protease subunit